MPKRKSARPAPPSMWTCPRCRRQFVHRHQAHSCGQYTVEQLLAGMPPGIIALLDRLMDMLRQCGDVVVAPTKTRILCKVRTVFATVAVKKSGLDLVLVLDRRLNHRRIKKAQPEYPGVVHFLRIASASDLDDDLAAWLQEAYAHRRAKDLAKA